MVQRMDDKMGDGLKDVINAGWVEKGMTNNKI